MPVSKDEVLWCYRLLLGREPESEEVVQLHMQSTDRNSLREVFLSSVEFAEQAPPSSARSTEMTIPSLPLDLGKLHIDVDVTPQQLQDMLRNTKATWEHLGITGAHHSVLTGPQYLPDNIAGSIDDFWASGVRETEILKKILTRHGCGDLQRKIGVEYGCGVGRVTTPFAMECRHVHAYDISATHISHAEAHSKQLSINNITFHICSENPLEPLNECDIFYSRLVFQHNPPPIIKLLIQRALQSLHPHGIGIFQVPTYMQGYCFDIVKYLRKSTGKEMEMHCLPQEAIFDVIRSEGCTLLEIREDASIGFPLSNMFVVKKTQA